MLTFLSYLLHGWAHVHAVQCVPVVRLLGSLALSASAALPEQWDFKFLSCRPHFLSPRPPSLLPPLCSAGSPQPTAIYPSRLSSHSCWLTSTDFFTFDSHSKVFFSLVHCFTFNLSFLSISVSFLSLFIFLNTHLSPLQLWTPASSSSLFSIFPTLFPPDSSRCQLSSPPSAAWTQQVSSPPDFAPTCSWREADDSNIFCLTVN